MSQRYILNNGIPVPEPDLMKWAEWFENQREERAVAYTESAGASVSTVFLGLDYNFGFDGSREPILYETMVFGGEHNGECERYSTKEEALAGHARMVLLCLPDPSSHL